MAELHVLGQVQESTERVRRHMHVHCPRTTCYRGFVPQLVLPQVLGASGFETTTLFCKCIPRAFLRRVARAAEPMHAFIHSSLRRWGVECDTESGRWRKIDGHTSGQVQPRANVLWRAAKGRDVL